MNKLSLLEKILFLINAIVASALLLALFLVYVSPISFPQLSVLSLAVPLLKILNLLFVVYWFIKLKKHLFLSLAILCLGWMISSPIYIFKSKTESASNDLTIMSYNVKMFSYYQLHTDSLIPKKTIDFIKQKDPDILAIQEYYQSPKINLNYPFKFVKTKSKNNKFGLAIFSKHKILNSGSFDFKNSGNNIIFCDILKDNDTIRVYNLHLESLKINPDKEYFGEANNEKLFGRLQHTFKKQAHQTEEFLEHEKKWKKKKIICGDFNNTAFSWVYKKIANDKKDAFIEAGNGFGKTFDYPFPLRIDFILTDNSITINEFNTFRVKYSDHFPIQARLKWEE